MGLEWNIIILSRNIIFLSYVGCSDWKAKSGKEWFHISQHASQILEIKSERKLSICVKGTGRVKSIENQPVEKCIENKVAIDRINSIDCFLHLQ